MATVLNWGRRRRRDTEGPKTKKKLADDDGKQEDNERWSGQKEKNKMKGRKLCPCRESPIVSPGLSHSEKVVESRCLGKFLSSVLFGHWTAGKKEYDEYG